MNHTNPPRAAGLLAILFAGLVAGLPACSTYRSHLLTDRARHIDPDPYTGVWTDGERTITVRDTCNDALRLTVTGPRLTATPAGPDDQSPRTYRGAIISLYNEKVLELQLSGDLHDDAVPVFLYGTLRQGADGSLTFTPLNAQWVDREIQESAGVDRGTLSNNAATVAVANPAAMRAMLTKALSDASAWGTPERLRPVK